MRTTLAIDDDVLKAAKALAKAENRSLGEVVSDLARRSLRRPSKPGRRRNGLLVTPSRGGPKATLDLVNALRDETE